MPVGARFSAPVQTSPGAHPGSCTMGTGSFPGVKTGRGVTLTSHHALVSWSRKSRAKPPLPYGPYGLYRTSVPVQGCTLPLPIPLLPLWTVEPVQSLSACTTVHFTYTSTSPMDRTACTEPQYLYNGALYLYLYLFLPLWTVRPVQSLSACTTVHCSHPTTQRPTTATNQIQQIQSNTPNAVTRSLFS